MRTLLKRAPLLTAICLACLVAASFYWQSLELWSTPEAMPTVAVPAKVEQVNKPARNIAQFKLFGDANKQAAPVAAPQKELPKTTLRLTLTGVSAGAGDKTASALIEGPDRSTLLYKVGDSVPGNATLNNVYDDRVVLNRSGRLENLYFPKVSKGGGQYLAQVKNEPTERSAVNHVQASKPSVDPSRKSSIKDRLNTLRNRIRNGQN